MSFLTAMTPLRFPADIIASLPLLLLGPGATLGWVRATTHGLSTKPIRITRDGCRALFCCACGEPENVRKVMQ
jgi:hypothetical protein